MLTISLINLFFSINFLIFLVHGAFINFWDSDDSDASDERGTSDDKTCEPNPKGKSCGVNTICYCKYGYYGDPKTGCFPYEICDDDETCPKYSHCSKSYGKCVCNTGYTGNPYKGGCVSINKCEDKCVKNAECVHTCKGWKCQCKDGFTGDGYNKCDKNDENCDKKCDSHAYCKYDDDEKDWKCYCKKGYNGNGYHCYPEKCDKTCDVNANCLFNSTKKAWYCSCKKGYDGNGYYCYPATCDKTCDVNAKCLFNSTKDAWYCSCKKGYDGNGYYCYPATCDKTCDVNAKCLFNSTKDAWYCSCKKGYDGNGYHCYPATCDKTCDVNANCLFNSTKKAWYCSCKKGYVGNGYKCTLSKCDKKCDPNAYCAYDDDEHIWNCCCKQGFQGNGYKCAPVKCDKKCGPNAVCTYSQMAWHCQCKDGYTAAKNGSCVCISLKPPISKPLHRYVCYPNSPNINHIYTISHGNRYDWCTHESNVGYVVQPDQDKILKECPDLVLVASFSTALENDLWLAVGEDYIKHVEKNNLYEKVEILGYAAPANKRCYCGANIPLYSFEGQIGFREDHFYTSNDEEKDRILKDPLYGNGYYWNKYKGVILYLWSSNSSTCCATS